MLTHASPSYAFAPHSNHQDWRAQAPIGTRVIRPKLVEASDATALLRQQDNRQTPPDAAISVDNASGTVRLVEGQDLQNGAAIKAESHHAYESAAREYIAAHPEVFGVNASDLVLDTNAVHISPEEQFIKLRIRRDGLDIADASIDFRFKFGRLIQVVNRTYSEAASDLRPGLTRLEDSARAALNEDGEVSPRRQLYRIETTDQGYQLVKVTEFDAITSAGERYLVQIENATGAVFEVRPTTFHLNGRSAASVHQRWYKESLAPQALPLINLPYSGGTVTTNIDGLFSGAPAAAEPSLQGFIGTKLRVNVRNGKPVIQPGSVVDDEWHVVWQSEPSTNNSNDRNVAQAMVYFHGMTVIQHAKAIIPEVRWLDRQLTANTNLSQHCNAHWDGSSINFYSGGSGCANTALIADVIYHEWGHGLDDNTGGIEDGAWSEGFGDIIALSETGSNILGIGFRLNGNPVRDLEPNKVYPRDADTEVHAEGLIIASTFYDLYKDLRSAKGDDAARLLLRRFALKSILTASYYTDVYDALLVIDDDNGNLKDGTPHFCAINRNFAAHGLAKVDQQCLGAGLNKLAKVSL